MCCARASSWQKQALKQPLCGVGVRADQPHPRTPAAFLLWPPAALERLAIGSRATPAPLQQQDINCTHAIRKTQARAGFKRGSVRMLRCRWKFQYSSRTLVPSARKYGRREQGRACSRALWVEMSVLGSSGGWRISSFLFGKQSARSSFNMFCKFKSEVQRACGTAAPRCFVVRVASALRIGCCCCGGAK